MNRIQAEWSQALDDSGKYGIDDSSFATDESFATFTVDVPYHSTGDVKRSLLLKRGDTTTDVFEDQGHNLHLFVAQALGYSKYNGPDVNLTRWAPARHPMYPTLRCKKISSVKGIHEQRREQSPLGRITGADLKIQTYSVYRMTLLFQALTYEARLDEETPDNGEADRYVTELIQPRAEILQRPGGQFYFIDGSPPARSNETRSFPQPINMTLGAFDMVWVWHQVPRQAVFNGRYPTRIVEMLGKVNDSDVSTDLQRTLGTKFAGRNYIAGELLVTGAVITPELAPVIPRVMGLGPFETPRTYRVEYHISVDPRGHNKKPSYTDNQWYLVTHNGRAPIDGKTIYEPGDFSKLFKPL